jgi:hypothetical protein
MEEQEGGEGWRQFNIKVIVRGMKEERRGGGGHREVRMRESGCNEVGVDVSIHEEMKLVAMRCDTRWQPLHCTALHCVALYSTSLCPLKTAGHTNQRPLICY